MTRRASTRSTCRTSGAGGRGRRGDHERRTTRVNGEWAGQNRYLLTDILRDPWGFQGVTVWDFACGLRDAAKSLEAGLDVEEPIGPQRAPASTRSSHRARPPGGGRARRHAPPSRPAAVYAACEPPGPVRGDRRVEHRALAREVSARAMVLLRNEPLGAPGAAARPRVLRRIAVIGRLADAANTGDLGSSMCGRPGRSPRQAGLRGAARTPRITVVEEDDPSAAARVAARPQSDRRGGYTTVDEGEYVGSSRPSRPS